jgi:hypothetical protein
MRERTKPEILNADFLEIRQRILDLAAMLDRYDAAVEAQSSEDQSRLSQIRAGIATLTETDRSRAEAVQQIFSLPYDENWFDQFDLKKRF